MVLSSYRENPLGERILRETIQITLELIYSISIFGCTVIALSDSYL